MANVQLNKLFQLPAGCAMSLVFAGFSITPSDTVKYWCQLKKRHGH